MNRLQRIYDLITTKIIDRLRDPFLLVARLIIGYQFFVTGQGKFAKIDNVVNFFTTLGLPMPEFTARFVSGVEMIGGALLFIGLASRLTALVLSGNMFVAYLTASPAALKTFDEFVADAAFPFLLVSLIVLLWGPGVFSADWLIRRKFFKVTAPQLAAATMLALAVIALPVHAAAPPRALATFAAGCFWCSEAAFDSVPGVVDVISGYTGGNRQEPSYEEVSAGVTGHRESVQVTYDPTKISYEKLLDVFWHNVDPFDRYGQFCDKGEQYKGAIYYHDEVQHRAALASKEAVQKRFPNQRVVTDIIAASRFWPAEEYHQDYHTKNPIRYTFYRHGCGRDARLEQIWGK
ncbi:MAG TPA: peptide-methionine (S)-S-oxide reductase MsrA [Thermoanaerobaculia bacterium]